MKNTKEWYLQQLGYIEQETNFNISKLRKEYVEANAEFKVGNYVYNVTGIIKIEQIEFSTHSNDYIIYHGYKYKKVKGALIRTREKEMVAMWHGLKKVVL